MNKKILLLIIVPLLASCSNDNQSVQYQAINDQQTIMKDYYRQHTSNQAYLSKYTYKYNETFDPTYDIFGELSPISYKNSYYEKNISEEIGVYSGYFIAKTTTTEYIGNKQNVGSLSTRQEGVSFWFREFENKDAHPNEKELIRRDEIKDNDIDVQIVDTPTETAVPDSNISHYFSNNINTDYKAYFIHPLVQPTATTTKKVSAYAKSNNEIIESTSEITQEGTITNPIHPGDEYKMYVYKETKSETTFKRIDKIGWVGTEFKEKVTYAYISDYNLEVLSEPRIVKQNETNVQFTYSTSIQAYSGESFVFQAKDTNADKYIPYFYSYNSDNYTKINVDSVNVTAEYKKLHPIFSGYAYHFSNIYLEEGVSYCFSTKEDIESSTPNYEAIGFAQIIKDGNGTVVNANINGHNLFKTITIDETYEAIVLISSGVKSLIIHLI